MMEKRSMLIKGVRCALIAAIYAATSLALAPIAFGGVQFRISEALTLLPILMPEAVVGVTLGCAITNGIGAMMGVNILGILDVFVGTLATLLAAVLTRKLRHFRWRNIPLLAMLPPVLLNAVFIGGELAFALTESGSVLPMFWAMAISVGIGQLVSCGVLGIPLVMQLERVKWKR